MKKFIIFLVLTSSPAFALPVLGEMKGPGQVDYKKIVDETHSNTSAHLQCSLHLHIFDNDDTFSLDSSYAQCGDLVLKDTHPILKKQSGKLYDDSTGKPIEVGQILPDGTLSFQRYRPTEIETATEIISGPGCLYEGVSKKTFYLNSHTIYKFKKNPNDSWDVDLEHSQDSVVGYTKKDGLCRYEAYSLANETTHLSGTVR